MRDYTLTARNSGESLNSLKSGEAWSTCKAGWTNCTFRSHCSRLSDWTSGTWRSSNALEARRTCWTGDTGLSDESLQSRLARSSSSPCRSTRSLWTFFTTQTRLTSRSYCAFLTNNTDLPLKTCNIC